MNTKRKKKNNYKCKCGSVPATTGWELGIKQYRNSKTWWYAYAKREMRNGCVLFISYRFFFYFFKLMYNTLQHTNYKILLTLNSSIVHSFFRSYAHKKKII